MAKHEASLPADPHYKPKLDTPSSILNHLAMLHNDKKAKLLRLERFMAKQADINREINELKDDIQKMDNEHDRLLEAQAKNMGYC